MLSVWSESSRLPAFESLRQNIKTDVLIIGGGMAGILCACALARRGVDYVLLESNTVCGGVTKHNGENNLAARAYLRQAHKEYGPKRR